MSTKIPSQLIHAGGIVQVVDAEFNTPVTTTSTMPHDGSIPQNNEGIEVVTVAITPKNANNFLLVEGYVTFGETSNSTSQFGCAMFRDSIADAFVSAYDSGDANETIVRALFLAKKVVAGSIASTIFKLRAAIAIGTTGINRKDGIQPFGAPGAGCWIRVWEIAA